MYVFCVDYRASQVNDLNKAIDGALGFKLEPLVSVSEVPTREHNTDETDSVPAVVGRSMPELPIS